MAKKELDTVQNSAAEVEENVVCCTNPWLMVQTSWC